MSASTNIQVRPNFKQASGSTPLWAHLLRRDISTLPADPGITITPTAPLDKNGTSMRLLLHDTQANFEKFSERVDKLTAGVDDARKEIVLVKNLFQQEHGQLEKDMVDLVNRCQTQVQHSIGEPAQALKVEDLRKDVQSTDRRLEFLDKRIDALHTLTQTQTQTLQTQSQALQTLQDQQGTIITAIMPLLPLLQAVPLHIESARTNLKELLLQIQSQTTPLVGAPSSDHWPRTGKRSSPALHSDGPLSSPANISVGRKRPRIEFETVPAVRPQEPQSSPTLPSITAQIQSRSYHAPLNRRQTTQVSQPQPRRFRSPFSAIPLTNSKNSLAAAFPIQQQAPQTPRVPLSDLPTPTDNARVNHSLSNPTMAQNMMQFSQTVHAPSPSLLPAFTSSNQRSLRTLRVLPSISRQPSSSTSTKLHTSIPTKLHNQFTNKEPERPSHVDDIFSSSTSQVQQAEPRSGPSSVTPGPATFPLSPGFQIRLPAKTPKHQPPLFSGNRDKSLTRSSIHPSSETPVPRNDNNPVVDDLMLVSSDVPAPKVKPMSIKDRPATFRNAHKRFIPLDDDGDDDEE